MFCTLSSFTPAAIDALLPEEVINTKLRLGDYQTDVLTNNRAWSGADITGKASKWGARYAQSRRNALSKVNAVVSPHGVGLVVVKGKRGKLDLQWTVAGLPLPIWNAAAERPGLAGMVEA